jgi:hypothetical protein
VPAVPATTSRALGDRFGILVNVFSSGRPSERLFDHLADIARAEVGR